MHDDEKLRRVAVWRDPDLNFEEFERASGELSLVTGMGLPGTVWERGHPCWLGDVLASDTFIREKALKAVGLRGGLAFPVRNGDERIGVIELFSREIRERDPELYALTEALGRQIGEFMEAVRARQAVRVSEARKGRCSPPRSMR